MPLFPDPAPFNSAIPVGYWTQLDKFMNSLGYFFLGNPDFGSGSAASAGTALNAMITALPSTGGTIWVPPGDWTVDQAVLWTKNSIEIRGMGRASRLLWNGGTIPTAFAMTDTTQRSGIAIRDLQILNTGVQASGTAVDASHCLSGLFENLVVDGSAGNTNAPLKGLLLNSSDTIHNVLRRLRINVAGASAEGIAIKGGSVTNRVRDARVSCAASGGKAIFVDARSAILDGVHVEGGSSTGFGVDVGANAHDLTLISPCLIGNDINLRLASGVESVKVKGGTIDTGVTWNIQDLGSLAPEIDAWVLQEPFRYRGNVAGGAFQRWIMMIHDMIEGTPSVDTTVAAGRVFLSLFEMPEGGFVDGVKFLTGATVAGNATVGIIGPVPPSAEDTAASLNVVVQSGSTAISAAATSEQLITFTKTYLKPGRYYAACEYDNATNVVRRPATNNVAALVGLTQRYDRGGGYGALTSPTPAITAAADVQWMQVRGAPLTTI